MSVVNIKVALKNGWEIRFGLMKFGIRLASSFVAFTIVMRESQA